MAIPSPYPERSVERSNGEGLTRSTPSGPRKFRCLVVDDEAAVCETIADVLTPAMLVETARDGATAIEAVVRHPPDVILLDLRLPDMSGLRVLAAIRGLRVDLPVVVLTGHSSEAAAIAAANLAVAGYLLKPFGVAELRQAVTSALALRFGLREGLRTDPSALHAEIALLDADPSPSGSLAGLSAALGVPRWRLRALGARGRDRGHQRARLARRIDQAKVLLRETREPIKAIAAHLGFHDSAHFCRAFRRWVGQTPRTYRRRARAPASF